ncbi:hypothetical protein V7L32_003788 [Salmonella enterica]
MIEKEFSIIFRKIKNNTTFFAFLSTIFGAWFLQAFSAQHIVRFMDLINTSLVITAGAIFLIILIVFLIFIIPAIYFSFKLTNLIVSKITKSTEKNKFPHIFFIIHAVVSGILSCHLSYVGIIIIASAYYLLVIIYMLIKTREEGLFLIIKKAVAITFLLLIIIFISYAEFGLPFILLNYEIHNDIFDNNIIIAIAVSLITWVLTNISYTYSVSSIKFYTSFIVCSTFALSILLETQFSEKIVHIIGIGLQERCYYTTDLEKYRIPTELSTRIDKQRTKLFVVADTGEKVYISGDSHYQTAFIFRNHGLSEVSCGESLNSKPTELQYNIK